MKLNQLKKLHRHMQKHEIDRVQFKYRHNGSVFDLFFFIDETPYILLIGSARKNLTIELPIQTNFQLNLQLHPKAHTELLQAIHPKQSPFSPYKHSNFFEQLNSEIPQLMNHIHTAHPHDIARYRYILEEGDKIYFRGWIHHNIRPNNVQPTNLHKTKALLGTKAFETCRAQNIKSCWSDKPEKAHKVELPHWGIYA